MSGLVFLPPRVKVVPGLSLNAAKENPISLQGISTHSSARVLSEVSCSPMTGLAQTVALVRTIGVTFGRLFAVAQLNASIIPCGDCCLYFGLPPFAHEWKDQHHPVSRLFAVAMDRISSLARFLRLPLADADVSNHSRYPLDHVMIRHLKTYRQIPAPKSEGPFPFEKPREPCDFLGIKLWQDAFGHWSLQRTGGKGGAGPGRLASSADYSAVPAMAKEIP